MARRMKLFIIGDYCLHFPVTTYTHVGDLIGHISLVMGLKDNTYFGLFASPSGHQDECWLDRGKPVEEEVPEETDSLYLRIALFVPNPNEITDPVAKALYVRYVKDVLDSHRETLIPEEFSILESTFNHITGRPQGVEATYRDELSQLPSCVATNSFLIRVSRCQFYMDGTMRFSCQDKLTGNPAEAVINFTGVSFIREKLLFVIKWGRFCRISLKKTSVKMHVRGEKSRNIPTQSISLNFLTESNSRCFYRVCTEYHRFFTEKAESPTVPTDLDKYSLILEQMDVLYIPLPFSGGSYQLTLAGTIEEGMPLHVARVERDYTGYAEAGDLVLFMNDQCTLKFEETDVTNLTTCNGVIGADIRAVVIKGFVSLADRSLLPSSPKMAQHFTNLVNLEVADKSLAHALLARLPQTAAPKVVLPATPGEDTACQESIQRIQADLESNVLKMHYACVPKIYPGRTINLTASPAYVHLNRYRDTVPYDQNMLTVCSGLGYINASLINFHPEDDFHMQFVASQGPTDSTSGDFYQMIWDRGVKVVVMLTALVEKGVPKCHKYWPDDKQTAEFADFRVTNEGEDKQGNYIMTRLAVQHKKHPGELTVLHYRFTGWPDHGVPDDVDGFIEFVRTLDQVFYESDPKMEPVIHCSAGVGRTGVLICCLIITRLIRSRRKVVPQEILKMLRHERALMIQTPEQYIFVCRCAIFNLQTLEDLGDQTSLK